MHQSLRKLLPLDAAALLALSTAAAASSVKLSGIFAGENSATHQLSGEADAILDRGTNQLKYTIDCGALSGPVTIAPFHGPAKPSLAASALKRIPGRHKSGTSATVTFDVATQAAMLAGMTCVNLHTTAHPKCVTRAQLMVSDSVGM